MARFDSYVINQYEVLTQEKKDHVLQIYKKATLPGNIITILGFIGFIIPTFQVAQGFLGDSRHLMNYYTDEIASLMLLAWASLIGALLVSFVITSMMHAHSTSKYPYYTKQLGKYAEYKNRTKK